MSASASASACPIRPITNSRWVNFRPGKSKSRPWQPDHWSWTALTREKHIDFILAVGGNLVIDCCKVVAAQAVLEDIWDMELVQYQLHNVSPILMGWWSHRLRYKGRDGHHR